MLNGVILALWEMRRISRSRGAMVVLVTFPVLFTVVSLLVPHMRVIKAVWWGFPALGALVALLLLYFRSASDRMFGFTDGVESTPAAGSALPVSRIVVCILLVLVQTFIYRLAVTFLG